MTQWASVARIAGPVRPAARDPGRPGDGRHLRTGGFARWTTTTTTTS